MQRSLSPFVLYKRVCTNVLDNRHKTKNNTHDTSNFPIITVFPVSMAKCNNDFVETCFNTRSVGPTDDFNKIDKADASSLLTAASASSNR
eukprot:m.90750 g.90750  ORF g.90750 m.90750 type:complete len:90 (-) comp26427_c0_seq3:285-554(-)